MASVQQLIKEKKKLEEAAAKLDSQIKEAALASFTPQLAQVVEMAGQLEAFDRDVKRYVKSLVGAVFGEDYTVQKKASSPASDKTSQSFDWKDLAKTLKDKGITSKANGLSKLEIERLFFGNDNTDFSSKWNDKDERAKVLKTFGKLRNAIYWSK